jgi:hypothetical protein
MSKKSPKQNEAIQTFTGLGSLLDDLTNAYSSDPTTMWLFRGQDCKESLMPAIARANSETDPTTLELSMLNELKRRSGLLVKESLNTEWDWLVYAQHFGLKTRLLDWTSNPLVALWFAVQSTYRFNETSYLYILGVDAGDYLTKKELDEGPFDLKYTKVLKPTLNNHRIIAQQGWFTIHYYSTKKKRFSFFEKTTVGKGKVFIYEIPPHLKTALLTDLNMLGVNYHSMFPDIVGLCNQINYENKIDRKT